MTRLFRFTLISFKDLAVTVGPALLLIIAILWGAYAYIDPVPPSHVTMSSGPAKSGYANYALKYQQILAAHGITLDLKTSEGSLENLNRLNDDDSDVQIAFVQSGTTDEASSERDGLVSLGSLFVEPIWLFSRNGVTLKNLTDLKKKRLNIGTEGSGVPRLAGRILRANHLELTEMTLSNLEDEPASEALLTGDLDAIMISSSPNSPVIQKLLRSKNVQLFDFTQAEAYTRRFPFLKHVVLPRGIVSFNEDLPPHDIDLLAPTATLVATNLTHPAILELLMEAAEETHSGPGWFRRAGEFPNASNTEIPVAKEAVRFYKSGTPFLQHYLPFWLANVVDRMWVVLVSMLVLIVPLSRIVPPVYAWRVRSRVYRWYGQLREVEHEFEAAIHASGGAGANDIRPTLENEIKQLDDIEERVNRLSVPLSYADELYSLRVHIDLVREKIRHNLR